MPVSASASASGPTPPTPQQVEESLTRSLRDGQKMIGLAMRQSAGTRSNVRTGAQRRSVEEGQVQKRGNVIEAVVSIGGPGAPYAVAQDQGSGLEGPNHAKYPIVPVHAKALAWPGPAMGPPGGAYRRASGAFKSHIQRHINAGLFPISVAYVFARKVMHPGVKATRWASAAWEETIPEVARMTRERLVQLMSYGA